MISDSDSDWEDMLLLYIAKQRQQRKTRQKSKRQRKSQYLARRGDLGRFAKDFHDLTQNTTKFRENFHMDLTTFNLLFTKVSPFLVVKRNTRPKDKISPKEKFAAVLEFFACGTLQRHVASIYRISKQHFGKCIDEVCIAIVSALKSEIPPYNSDAMVETANDYNFHWNFPNCVGSIDGKHIAIKCPPNAGSMFFNYKGFHSIILLAVADAEYRFSYLDVGAYGSEGDAAVFSNSNFGKLMARNRIKFPKDATIQDRTLPYFFIGDDAFPLGKRLIKPYTPKRNGALSAEETIFNYRLSRARRCIENAFGILCSRWYCLARTMYCSPDRAQKIVTACCYIHNFLINRKSKSYCPAHYCDRVDPNSGDLIEGDWRKNINENSMIHTGLQANRGRPNDDGKAVREALKSYVNSTEGSVPWQSQSAYI